MRQTLTISIPEELKKQLDRISADEDVSRSEIVKESLTNYLYIRQFRAIRNKMLIKTQSKGISLTDDDVFGKVS